jgi:hypothetical protein
MSVEVVMAIFLNRFEMPKLAIKCKKIAMELQRVPYAESIAKSSEW